MHYLKIFFTLLFFSILILDFSGCKKDDSNPLTPARTITATWKTPLPVKFYHESDFCGDYQTEATAMWTVTWVITAGSDENHVNIKMNFSYSDYTKLNTTCGEWGWTPEVSPWFLTGTISSTTLNVYDGTQQIATMNFTTDNMTGTWNYKGCFAYCSGEHTLTNALILNKQ